jgi:hypothetical protein
VRVATENETETGTSTEETAPEVQETEATETPTEDKGGETPPEDEKKSEDEDLDPKVLRDLLSKTRAEAANYRTKLREAETKLSEAKTPEEIEKAVAELKAQNEALERSVLVASVAREFELPNELAELLKGDDEEALKKHAKALQKFVTPNTPESLDGGLHPTATSGVEEFDPVAEARKARARRY